jgi:NADPH:quinone reductase-like Zn-dependent oxidoreductase
MTNGGAYAEYVAANPQKISLKPVSVSFAEAASIPVVAQTAWQGLFTHAHLKQGQTILIHGGAGAVGGYAVQFAHQAGAKVIVTASGADRNFLKSLGADEVIDYKTERFESLVNGVDAVFDLVGGETQQRSYAVLKQGGHLVAVNQPPSPEEAKKHQVSAVMMDMKPSTEGLKHIADLIDSGKIRTDVAEVFPLEKAAESWSGMAAPSGQKNKHGKIVLTVF